MDPFLGAGGVAGACETDGLDGADGTVGADGSCIACKVVNETQMREIETRREATELIDMESVLR